MMPFGLPLDEVAPPATGGEIHRLVVHITNEGQPWDYTVGERFGPDDDLVSRIEEIKLPGLHCDIPHLRVWAGERRIAEFSRHAVVGVLFS